MSFLRFPGDRDYLGKGRKREKLEACQLAAEDKEEEVGRTTDDTHRNTVGAKELHVQFGDFLDGFNEPTSTVKVLASLTFKSVFIKSWAK